MMDLQIQTKRTDLDPAWRDLVEHATQRIGERYPELLRLHVTLSQSRHHHGATRVSLLANAVRRTITVSKEKEEFPDALHAAFQALEDGLDRFHRERRGSRRVRILESRAS